MSGLWDDDEPKKRVPTKLLRRIVWERDRGICQLCGGSADPMNWELAHNRAYRKGGKLTEKNTFVAHPACNRSQGTMTKKSALRAAGFETREDQLRRELNQMSLAKLKELAKKHGVHVQSRVIEHFFSTERKAPTKRQYVNELVKVMK